METKRHSSMKNDYTIFIGREKHRIFVSCSMCGQRRNPIRNSIVLGMLTFDPCNCFGKFEAHDEISDEKYVDQSVEHGYQRGPEHMKNIFQRMKVRYKR